jgi:hypothetical protein
MHRESRPSHSEGQQSWRKSVKVNQPNSVLCPRSSSNRLPQNTAGFALRRLHPATMIQSAESLESTKVSVSSTLTESRRSTARPRCHLRSVCSTTDGVSEEPRCRTVQPLSDPSLHSWAFQPKRGNLPSPTHRLTSALRACRVGSFNAVSTRRAPLAPTDGRARLLPH